MKIKIGIGNFELDSTMRIKFDDVFMGECVQIFDENNNRIYYEGLRGCWAKREFDKNNNMIYHEDSDGYWIKQEFDKDNNQIYCEDSSEYWTRREFDENNNEIYYENSNGLVIDNKPKKTKELTMEEISKLLGYEVKIVK